MSTTIIQLTTLQLQRDDAVVSPLADSTDPLVLVIGIDPPAPGAEYVAMVTQDVRSEQFIDYVAIDRVWTVVRTVA